MNDPSQAPKLVNEKPDRDGRLLKIVLDGKRPITEAGDPTMRAARGVDQGSVAATGSRVKDHYRVDLILAAGVGFEPTERADVHGF